MDYDDNIIDVDFNDPVDEAEYRDRAAEEPFITEEEAAEQLNRKRKQAQRLLNDEDSMERFLQRLEKKLKKIPVAGEKLSEVPVMVSLLRMYARKEYRDIPLGSIIAVVCALLYFLSPFDLVPDSIPVIGYFDDAAVVATCWKLVETDIVEYNKWRKENGRLIDGEDQ